MLRVLGVVERPSAVQSNREGHWRLLAEAVWKRTQIAKPVATPRAATILQPYFHERIAQAVLRAAFRLWTRTFLRWSARI